MDPEEHYASRPKLMLDAKVRELPQELGVPRLARYTREAVAVRQVVQHMPYQSDTEALEVVEMVLDHLAITLLILQEAA